MPGPPECVQQNGVRVPESQTTTIVGRVQGWERARCHRCRRRKTGSRKAPCHSASIGMLRRRWSQVPQFVTAPFGGITLSASVDGAGDNQGFLLLASSVCIHAFPRLGLPGLSWHHGLRAIDASEERKDATKRSLPRCHSRSFGTRSYRLFASSLLSWWASV